MSSSRGRQKWIESRNFWTFFISATFASLYFVWVLRKCYDMNNVFDHIAANRHFESWGNTIALFWGVFVMHGILKSIFPIRGNQPPPENLPPVNTDDQ